ncbi:hypothetical protein SKAU_G00147750 [Synaphobranchus kaupii]|uniref:Uncharacterized protein n=1 Tax=Synaphobranchus kaupii TaxID=118154 RepID=A0A9Q1J3X7_SYNKA|nr:hypothetical protein SKAU_G00147750 [Synaphobranchus kaupii]
MSADAVPVRGRRGERSRVRSDGVITDVPSARSPTALVKEGSRSQERLSSRQSLACRALPLPVPAGRAAFLTNKVGAAEIRRPDAQKSRGVMFFQKILPVPRNEKKKKNKKNGKKKAVVRHQSRSGARPRFPWPGRLVFPPVIQPPLTDRRGASEDSGKWVSYGDDSPEPRPLRM